MLPIARLGDLLSATGALIIAGSGNVFANGLPVAKLGDMTSGHAVPGCAWPPTPIAVGSGSVFINGLPAARLSDLTAPHVGVPCGAPHPDIISTGSGNIFCG